MKSQRHKKPSLWSFTETSWRDLEVRAGPVPRLLDVLLNPGQTCANKAASFL